MKPAIFAEIWDAVWPHKALSPMALRLIWGPEIIRIDDAKSVAFLRAWARENTWPPSLHEYLVGVGAVDPAKPIEVTKSKTVQYTCEHCGTQIDGTLEFERHLDAEHKDQRADPVMVAGLIDDWKRKRTPVLDLTGDTDESPNDGTPTTGEEDAKDSSATNGNSIEDLLGEPPPPDPEAVLEGMAAHQERGTKPTASERAQLMETQAGLEVGGEPVMVPDTDNTPLDDQEAWVLASRNLRDHDGRRIPTKDPVQPCTVCDVFAMGLVFRAAPISVAASGLTKGEPMAGRCWGCQALGRSDRFGMPVPSHKTRPAWKRLSDLVAPKGWHKPARALWINAALDRTRGMLKARADADSEPQDTSEPCGTCGDREGGSRLLFGTADALYEQVYAGLCWDCGGSPLYAEVGSEGWSGLPIAPKQNPKITPWVAYGVLFTDDADRNLVVSKAVQRTKALDEWPPDLVTPWRDDPTDSQGEESQGVGTPEALPEGSGKASEPDLDDELPC